MSTARQRVIAYIAFVAAFALAAHYAAPKVGRGAAAFVVMWTPALAALAASVLTRRSLGAIGWRLWPIKWLAAGWIIPSLYAFPAYALVWLAGLGSVPSPTFLERARFTLGMPSEANWLVIVSAFGYISLLNLLPNMLLALGEELGWRGFLVPELTTWVGFRRASLYSGAIWGAWQERSKLDFRGEFYQHTLMTPFFDPGPLECARPRVFLAGVGPLMTEVAGEVADGFLVHPFHTLAFVREQTLPALERGLARGGKAGGEFEIACQVMLAVGRTREELERAREAVRFQIAFYASTPAYRGVLVQHGWEALQPELNRLSKSGAWPEMAKRVGDELVDAVAVSGSPEEVAAELRARCGFAQRIALVTPYGVDPTVIPELVSSLRA